MEINWDVFAEINTAAAMRRVEAEKRTEEKNDSGKEANAQQA